MSRYRKKHKGIIEKAKSEVRSIRNEAMVQAGTATSISQIWKNYMDTIDRVVKEWKHSRKNKKAK